MSLFSKKRTCSFKSNLILGFIVVIALVLRIIRIDQSVWLDEAISVQAVIQNNFWGIITKFTLGDFHPSGYYLLLELWTTLFGTSEISIRIPSIIFSILTIFFGYKLATRLFNKQVGLLSALFIATNPLFVYYSQEARMYSMAAFFVVASFYFLNGVIKGVKYSPIFYLLANFGILLIDYTAYFIFPAQLFFLLLAKSKQLLKVFILVVISVALYLPLLIMQLPYQLSLGLEISKNLPAWSQTVGGANLKELFLVGAKLVIGRISIENKIVYVLIVLISIAMYLFAIFQLRKNKIDEIKLLSAWIIIPLLLAYLISFFVPVLSYFRLLYIAPPLYILVAAGISNKWNYKSKIIVAAILITSLVSLAIYYTTPKFQRENWREAVKFAESFNGNETEILFEDNHTPPPYTYYSSLGSNLTPALKNIPARSMEDIVGLESIFERKRNILVFEYLFEINDPEKWLIKIIENKGFTKNGVYDFPGVGFVVKYEKNSDRME